MTTGLQFVIRHVDTVADVAAARAFYLEKVGLTIDTDTEGFIQFQRPTVRVLGFRQVEMIPAPRKSNCGGW